MYQVEDNLNKLGIRLRNFAIGNHKTKCPECQPHAHNPKDNPLSVTVESDHAIYNCHHCGFSGGVGDGSITSLVIGCALSFSTACILSLSSPGM